MKQIGVIVLGAGLWLFGAPVLATDKSAGFVSPGKPSAPVTAQSEPLRLDIGERGLAMVNLATTAAVDQLSVTVLPSDGLEATSNTDDLLSLVSGSQLQVPIEVRGLRDGLWHVNVLVTTQRAGNTRHRIVAVPVHVGTGALQLKANGLVQQTSDGERVVSLPAQETIR